MVGTEGFEPPRIAPFALEANASPIPPRAQSKNCSSNGFAPSFTIWKSYR